MGDAIVLIHGTHAINVIEDMQCISVKQGPFLGTEFDQVCLRVLSCKRKGSSIHKHPCGRRASGWRRNFGDTMGSAEDEVDLWEMEFNDGRG